MNVSVYFIIGGVMNKILIRNVLENYLVALYNNGNVEEQVEVEVALIELDKD